MSRFKDRYVEVGVDVLWCGPMSLHVTDGDAKCYIPYSQMDPVEHPDPSHEFVEGDSGTISVARWLAEKEGLV